MMIIPAEEVSKVEMIVSAGLKLLIVLKGKSWIKKDIGCCTKYYGIFDEFDYCRLGRYGWREDWLSEGFKMKVRDNV